MARAAAKRTKGPKEPARRAAKPAPRAPKPPKPVEKTLFFARIRGQTKWVFAILAVVFALSFVVAGVGSGSTGFGSIVDALGGIFGTNDGSSETSVTEAQKRIEKNPRDAQAFRDLARAYELEGQNDLAIGALEDYLKLGVSKENRISALNELAGLYETRKRAQEVEVQIAAFDAETASGSSFGADPNSPLGRAFGTGANPIRDAQVAAAEARFQQAQSLLLQTLTSLQSTYKRLTDLDPTEPTYLILYGDASLQLRDNDAALAAYREFVKKFPENPEAAEIRRRIKQLESASASQASG